jgi:chemotaxis protein MotA
VDANFRNLVLDQPANGIRGSADISNGRQLQSLMISIVGILIVLGAIAGGYLMEHGNLKVLLQPAELIIIFGAAVGTVVVANPLPTLSRIAKGLVGVIGGGGFSKAFYLENLKMLYELFSHARKAGTGKLEEEVDGPEKGVIFKKYPKFLQSHHALHFLCDTLRTALSSGLDPIDIDHMMEVDLEVHHREAHEPVAALTTMADSLPGLGIVAAVLGVVITMGALGGAKEEIGHRVAAALVGTFLGILLCYGVFGPLASAMSKQTDAEGHYFGFLRMACLAYIKGLSPIIVAEMARRSIPTGVRPTFQEMEAACRGGGAASKAA